MVTLELIEKNPIQWNNFISLYLTSFPSDERRESEELTKIQGNEGYMLYQILHLGNFAGFLEVWEFGEFIFIEHLAIKPEQRMKGFGSYAIRLFKSSVIKPILLEAEPPTDVISRKRIEFYVKAGFNILGFDYTQPPYYQGKHSVPMLLLSNQDLDDEVIHRYVAIITQNVYKIAQ